MYTEPGVWLAIVTAGIIGCIVTAMFASSIKGVPFGAVAGNIKKHIWSIIFAIPIPFLLGLGGDWGIVIAFLWLVIAPTVASKVHFGPKDVPALVLSAFHAGFGIAALTTFIFVTRYLMMAGS